MVRCASGHLSRERWNEELDQFFNISSQWWAYLDISWSHRVFFVRLCKMQCSTSRNSPTPCEASVWASWAGQHPYEKYRNLKQFHFQRFTQQMHRTGFSLDVCICVIIKVANKLWGVPSIIAYLEIELRNLHILIYTSPYFWAGFLHGLPCSLPCFETSMTQ